MANTLTWAVAGPYTQSGTTIGALVTDMKALVDSKAGDATFLWQHAGSNLGSSPYYVLLKPKSGAAGRMLFVQYSSAPAGNNSAIFEQAPATSYMFSIYFPNGNTDTASNLTAASGAICGNDTGCNKAVACNFAYGTGNRLFMAQAEDAVYFWTGTTSTGNMFFGAGNLVVDGSDNAVVAGFGLSNSSMGSYGNATTILASGWSSTIAPAGQGASCGPIRLSDSKQYFQAYGPLGGWAALAPSATDILSDTATNKAWFVPIQLIGQTKGEGLKYKFRQLTLGPGVVSGPNPVYNTTGPVVQAIHINPTTAAMNGGLWFTNFKV